jgi:hypothetical protein
MFDSGKSVSKSKLSSIFEAISLVSITLLLIGFYLIASGSISWLWLRIFGFLVVVGIVGSVAASYRDIKNASSIVETTKVRVTRQLVETLIAKQVPSDVIFGLKNMIKNGDQPVQSEHEFLKQLDATLGIERSREVQPIILKYAGVAEDKSKPASPKQPTAPESPPAPVEQNATGAAVHA